MNRDKKLRFFQNLKYFFTELLIKFPPYGTVKLVPITNFIHFLKRTLYNYKETNDLKKELSQYLREFKLINKDFYENSIYIKITNYWYPNYTYFERNEFFKILKSICNKYNKFLLYSDMRGDIEIFSVFGSKNQIIESKSKIKIFYTGEANSRYAEYKDNCLEYVNLSLGFNRIEHKNYIRFPIYIFHHFDYINLNKDNIRKRIIEINNAKYKKRNKTKFASLIATWQGEYNLRGIMYKRISKIDKINCPSRFMHNDNSLKNKFNDNKFEYLKQFKFNICPENLIENGYITEKLFDSFEAGCIPIWNGDKNIEPDIINKNAVLYWEKDSDNKDLLKEIERLYKDDIYYNKFISEPKLIEDNATDYIYNQIKRLHDRLEEIAEKLIRK